ncbi:inorganic phosphate transporter [Salix suchowensis]|nr:inorganic phosphate transporter [Salix suchowensis]
MGTEFLYKMYMPGYNSTKDIDDSSGNGSWPSHHENKAYEQHHGMLAANPEINRYSGYDKEHLRQTILRQENTFRHQVHELHRLHKIQMEIMNEVRSKGSVICLDPMRTFQSNPLTFSPKGDGIRWHDSGLPLVTMNCHIPSASGADSVQSHFSSINLQNMQSGCGSTHNVSTIRYDVSLEYNHKKLQRKSFDLELPADKYINDAEEEKGAFGGSGLESDPPNWNCRVTCEKNGNMSTLSSVHSSCNGDTFSSNTGRTQVVTDLNKPFQVEEAYDTTPFLGKVTYFKEEIQGRDVSANSCSGFQSMEKEVSRRPFKEKEEGLSQQNMLLDNEWGNKGRPPFNFNSGHISTVTPSRNFYGEYLPTQSESSRVGCMNAKVSDQNKPEQLRKKTIFGVEISNRNHNVSFMTSDALPPPPAPQSNVGNSESSSISSWKRPPSSLRQNAIFLQGNPCFNTFPESNKSSATLLQCHEVSADGSIVNEKVDFIPKPVVELSYKNDISLISQLKSKASAGHSNGSSASNFAFEQVPKRNPPNNSRASGWSENIKSAEEVNLNAVPPKSYPIEAISDSNHISTGIQEMGETPLGALSWMKTVSHCNGKSSGEMSDFQQVNWDSLQGKYADQFACNAGTMKDLCQNIIQDSSSATNAHDAEEKRIRGDCSSNKKILCVPTFEKPISKDLPPASSGLKPGFCVSETTGANSIKGGLLHTDLNQDAMESESVEILNTNSLNVANCSVDCRANLRHSIDLNVSVTEEEAQAPRNKARIAIQIDLEAPIVLENDMDIVSGGGFLESKFKEPFQSITDEFKDFHEGLLISAAEALVDISLSGVHQFQDDARCQILETEVNNPLQWFADIISSYKGYIKNDAGSLSVHKGNNDREDSTPDEVDFFEYMTLNLTETMVEDPDYEPVVLENTKDETSLPRGRRRGQARRGRQRKDFQRDVLPGLVSLSRNDVTDDLQMIEGMIIATGGTWQSGLSQRNSPKRKAGRGRKRTASSAAVPTVTTVSPPQAQHPNCGELGLEVTGWGKRTRRPPRQRYPTNNPLPHQ